MKPILLAFLLAINLGCALHRPAKQAQPASKPVTASLVRLTLDTPLGEATCSAFAIAPRKLLTAAHCVDEDGKLEADGKPAMVVKIDTVVDLAVLVADIDKPTLIFRLQPLEVGEPVRGVGFAYGFTKPIITLHTVALLKYELGVDIYPGTIVLNGFISGMSGGPIVDAVGDVVGIVQRGNSSIGYGVDTQTILTFLFQ